MKAAFPLRGLAIHPEEFDREMLEMCTRAKLNHLSLHPVGGPGAAQSLEDAIAAHMLPESRALRLEASARGIGLAYEAHALSWLLPRSLFDRHPEWFRMDERGERVREVNLCASCEEALAYVAGRMEWLARLLDAGQSRYFYWLDDAAGTPCRCPDCRRLSPSDQQMRVVNAMLTGLRRANPAAQLCYLAYGDALRVRGEGAHERLALVRPALPLLRLPAHRGVDEGVLFRERYGRAARGGVASGVYYIVHALGRHRGEQRVPVGVELFGVIVCVRVKIHRNTPGSIITQAAVARKGPCVLK